MSLVAGIDSSTQSCTVVLRDADDGRIVGTASAPHPPTTPPVSEPSGGLVGGAATGRSELDVHDVWALSVDGQGHGLVALDRLTGSSAR